MKKHFLTVFLFCFTISAHAQYWAWINGPTTSSVLPIYGTKGVASTTNSPGGRDGAATWTGTNNTMWLFGGIRGTTYMGGPANDLWRYNMLTSEWTWLHGSNLTDQPAIFGTMGSGTPSTTPGARNGHMWWSDNAGNFWLFGGQSTISSGTTTVGSIANDLWKYDPTSNVWTWMSGTTVTAHAGNYGTQGVGSSTNIPSGRIYGQTWTDNSGDLWLFGGRNYNGSYNDLWKYDITANTWTWVRGSSSSNQYGVYGTYGTPSSTTMPGSRSDATGFVDNSNNLWLFGGNGYASSASGLLNDLWKYNISTDEWTWVNGASGTYATTWYSSGLIGAREKMRAWKDGSGNFWIYGTGSSAEQWEYNMSNNTFKYHPNNAQQGGPVYFAQGVAHPWVVPVPAKNHNLWTDACGNLWSWGGDAYYNPSFLCGGFFKYDVAGAVNITSPNNRWSCGLDIDTLKVSSPAAIWYATATSTVPIATGSILTTTTLSPGTYTYFAEVNTCTLSVTRSAIFYEVYAPTAVGIVGPSTVCAGNYVLLNPVLGTGSYTWSTGSTYSTLAVNPMVTTTYTVVTANPNGCYAPGVITVTAIPKPVVSVTSPSVICNSATFTVTATGATSYSWSGGATGSSATMAPLFSNNYTVTGTKDGCNSFAAFSVSVIPLPAITAQGGSVCAGQPFTVTPSGGVSYSITGGNFIVTPTINTTYAVTGTGTNGCVKSTSVTILAAQLPTVSIQNGSICAGDAFTLQPSGAVSYTFSSGSSVVNPSVTSTYTISGVNLSGCTSNPATATITAYPLPQISVSGGTICEGNTFTLMPSGAQTYIYSDAQIISPTTTTTYSISGTSAEGCASSNTAVATITVAPAPSVSVQGGTLCAGQQFTLQPSGANTYAYLNGGPLVTPLSNTTYSVMGVSALMCPSSSLAIAVVSVVPLPTISVNSGFVCKGSSFTLNPLGAYMYTISGGSSVVSPTGNSYYQVTGSNQNGCASSVPATATVLVYALPPISIASERDSICNGESVSLHAGGALTYTWSNQTIGPNLTVYPAQITSYTVTGKDVAGCVNHSTITIIVDDCVGLAEQQRSSLFLFPNPSNGFVTARLKNNSTFSVFDLSGRVVSQGYLHVGDNELDLRNLPQGLYQLTIPHDEASFSTGTRSMNFRIVIEKE
jgi:hypothetical protein